MRLPTKNNSFCNLHYKVPRIIPIFFHNLSGYDVHLYIKEFNPDKYDIKLIAQNEESYNSFSKILRYKLRDSNENFFIAEKNYPIFKNVELRFLDSFKFVSSFLEELVNN